MTEHPILFCGELVKATLDGRKGMTRRVIKPQPPNNAEPCSCSNVKHFYIQKEIQTINKFEPTHSVLTIKCPYGKVGDLLWVKETLENYNEPETNYDELRYGQNHFTQVLGDIPQDWIPRYKWHRTITGNIQIIPSIFMPKWAARIWREITGIRVERLQDITEGDVFAEGCNISPQTDMRPFVVYQKLWNSLNAKWKRVYDRQLKIYEFWQFPWSIEDAKPIPKTTAHPERYHCVPNPWVWVIKFKKVVHK